MNNTLYEEHITLLHRIYNLRLVPLDETSMVEVATAIIKERDARRTVAWKDNIMNFYLKFDGWATN